MKKILTLFLFIILSCSVLAWNPQSHIDQDNKAIQQAPDAALTELIKNHYDDFLACDVLTDITVLYYFNEGFSSIGKAYRVTHTQNFCYRAIENAENDNQLACAYGICSHQVKDAVSHNDYVPSVIEKSYLFNAYVHALSEEKVDREVRDSNTAFQLSSSLSNKRDEHKEFIINTIRSDRSTQIVNLDEMYDKFANEVSGSAKYSIGFKKFFSVPMSLHLMIMMIFVLNVLIVIWLIRLPNKSIWNKILLVISIFIIVFIIGLYILFFTDNLWKAYQGLSYPLALPLPTQGWENHYQQSVSNTVKFLNIGELIMTQTQDPSGSSRLMKADQAGAWFRNILLIIIAICSVLFLWLNFKRR